MLRTSRTTEGLAVGAGLVLVLTACGGGGGGGGSSETPELGPLDAYFEEVFGDFTEQDFDAQQREAEERIAVCMREQGFDYTPVVYDGGVVIVDDEEIDWGSREFAAQYGYGVATWPGMEDPGPVDEGEVFEDPNQAYVDAMSDSERDAYYAALYGGGFMTEDEWDPDAEIPEWDPADSGCQGEAWGDGMGDPSMDERFQPLMDELMRVYEQMQSDPDVVAADRDWAECMADAGHAGMTSPMNAAEVFYERQNEIYDGVDWGMTEAEMDAAQAQVDEALAAMRDEEIAVALADFDCKEEVDHTARYAAVDHRMQQEFLDTHEAELAAYLEAMKEQLGA